MRWIGLGAMVDVSWGMLEDEFAVRLFVLISNVFLFLNVVHGNLRRDPGQFLPSGNNPYQTRKHAAAAQ